MPKRILIADDDNRFKEKAQLLLEKNGFETIVCESAREAEDICARTIPDLVITDLLKKNDDTGFVLCYRLKKLHPNLPIVLVSAVSAKCMLTFNIDSEDERPWINADAFIEKDITPEQLLKEVYKLLRM